VNNRSSKVRADKTARRQIGRMLAAAATAVVLGACATPQMEAQWRDPQLGAKSMQGRAVLVVCRGLDITLERICEDRFAADAQAIGIKVVRAEVSREAPADPAAASELLLRAARAVRADAVLATSLERGTAYVAPSGGSVGIGVGGSSGGWGSRTGGGIGITLPIGGASGPALAASTSLTDAVSGKLIWSARARGSGMVNEADQVGEVSRVTAEALKGAGLF
jgi:hypothetical protein